MRGVRWMLIALVVSCRSSTGVEMAGEPAGNVAANLVLETLQVAGGRSQVTRMTFDSLAGTYEELACPDGGTIATCPAAGLARRAGVVAGGTMESVWRDVASSQFRQLRSSYTYAGDVVPPDVHQVTLTVVVNQRRWQVTFDARTTVPAILSRLDCRLRVAAGALISCA